ncbi:MAG: DUF3108 domain-containing protein [Bacteroidaceae bacterium]|nr:DUF3108 domain-containing protein [Bacteroidaceae bacterium]
MKRHLLIIAAAMLTLFALPAAVQAQCTSANTAFKSGETLMYDLYFNWKFVWVKAGTAYMNTTQTTYAGKPAYKTYLITRGSKKADGFFVMRDTLTSYCGLDLAPIYYKKGALEGKTYRKNEVWYSYKNGQCNVKMRYQKNNGTPAVHSSSSRYCAYDMISMMLRARSFNPSGFKVGHRINFLMADGRTCDWQAIVYRGKKKFKMENSNTKYRCLVFSFVEKDKKSGKEEEVVTFYITDDKNHLPVRLDMNLNFGTAKAFLTGAKGLRNPQTAKLK